MTTRTTLGGGSATAAAPRRAALRHPATRRDGLAATGFLLPSMIAFLIFVVVPTAGMFALSLFRWNLLSDGQFIGLQNYERLFSDERLWSIYARTAGMAIAILIINVALGLLFAVLLESRMPRWTRTIFRMSFLFPFVISSVAVALIWRFLLDRDLGLVNYVLGILGVSRLDWLGSSALAPISIVIVASWKMIGFSILVYVAGLQSIPTEYKEAAIMDGASAWQRFWRITFPLLSPTIFFLLIINTINSLQIFAEPVLLTGGGPGDASRTIVQFIYNIAFESFDLGYASTVSLTLLAILIVLTVVQFRISRRWTFYG